MSEPSETTDPSDGVLRRVRALLERAEHPQTGEAEAETCMAKAEKIMAEYGIQRAMLAAAGEVDDPIDGVKIRVTSPYSYEKAMLLRVVAVALRCDTVRHYEGRVTTSMTVVGAASDRERVELLYTSLLVQAERGMLREKADRYGATAAETRQLRASYLFGFREVVKARLTEAEERAAREYDGRACAGSGAPGTALVLADREALVRRRKEEMFPDLVYSKNRRTYDSDAAGRGREGGRSADIGGAKVGGAGAGRLERSRS